MIKVAVLLPLLLGCFALTAQEFYRWTDANGQLHVSQSPPAKSVQYEVVTLQELSRQQLPQPRASTPSAANPSAAAAIAQQAAENTAPLDQQVEQLNKKAEVLQQQLDKQRCLSAQKNKAALERQAPVYTTDNAGKQTFLDDDQRAVQLEVAEEEISRFCQSNP
jgi:hypothetical protein